MQQPWYATREQVKRALDSAETARNNAQVDRAIASASRSIDSQMHRRFYPWDGTRYFGFRPWNDGTSSWRMWLGENDLVSVSTLTAGGTTISASDYFLEPANSGPPYTSLEIDLESNSVLQAGRPGSGLLPLPAPSVTGMSRNRSARWPPTWTLTLPIPPRSPGPILPTWVLGPF